MTYRLRISGLDDAVSATGKGGLHGHLLGGQHRYLHMHAAGVLRDVGVVHQLSLRVIEVDVRVARHIAGSAGQDAVQLNVEQKASNWVSVVCDTRGDVAEGYIIGNAKLEQNRIEITSVSLLTSASATMSEALSSCMTFLGASTVTRILSEPSSYRCAGGGISGHRRSAVRAFQCDDCR